MDIFLLQQASLFLDLDDQKEQGNHYTFGVPILQVSLNFSKLHCGKTYVWETHIRRLATVRESTCDISACAPHQFITMFKRHCPV